MYQRRSISCRPDEIAHLLAEAIARIPSQINGSFIVPYPYVPDALADAHVHRLRLVGLLPGQQIPLHVDARAECPGVRHHVPIQTNDGCWTFSVGDWQQLEIGRVYTMDPTEPHGAVNWGSTIRLHLLIDVES
jgi:hypothetical protein